MQTRRVRYTEHPVPDAHDARDFVLLEAAPDGGLHHALGAPRGWRPLLDIPIDPDPDAPALASVIVEDGEPGPDRGVLVCGSAPAGWAADARAVAEKLAARDGFAVYRWNDEDDEIGGARAMARTDTHVAAIRVLADGDGWAFFSGVVPKDRLAAIGGALQVGLSTFQLYPGWARD